MKNASHRRRRLRTVFQGTVPKHVEYPESNEDRFGTDDERQLYAVSDGASESYNSLLWAKILVESWLADPPKRNVWAWLQKAVSDYEEQSHRETMSWSEEAAYKRGSFASLLVVESVRGTHVRVIAVGDTTALYVKEGKIVKSFPYENAEQFLDRPHLISTILQCNRNPFLLQGVSAFRRQERDGPCHVYWDIHDSDDASLVCVTDAVAEWLLRDHSDNHGQRLKAILDLRSDNDYWVELVEKERSTGALRRDDSTVILLEFTEDAAADP